MAPIPAANGSSPAIVAGASADAALVDRYAEALSDSRKTPAGDAGALGTVVWIAPNAMAAAETRRNLVERVGGLLSPGVRTLRQAADALVGAIDRPIHPVGSTAERRLVAEVVARQTRREDLGPLVQLAGEPGLVAWLMQRFTRLRLEGAPVEAVVARLRAVDDPVEPPVGRLYGRYVRELSRSGLVDAAQRIALAIDALADHPRLRLLAAPWQPRELSPLETRWLARLAGHADETLVAAPAGEAADRFGDAAQRSIAWATGDAAAVRPPATAPATAPAERPSAIARLARDLFAEGAARTGDRPTAIDVVAGANEQDELRRVAHRIKRLLTDGDARPRDVVIAARRMPDRGERLAGVLRDFGVPAAIEAPRRLRSSALASAMRLLVNTARASRDAEPVLALIARDAFTVLDESTDGFATLRAATEWLVRESGAATGLAGLMRQAESLAQRAANDPSAAWGLSAAAPAALSGLRRIAHAIDALPTEATPIAWLEAIGDALTRLGYEPAEGDDAARGELERALAEVEASARWRGRDTPVLSLEGAAELLTEIVGRLPLPRRGDDEGRVRVVSAETAATLALKRFYLIGLQEDAFAADAEASQAREMLLFYELVSRPTVSLTLSYAALDADAQPLHPSPYLQEVEGLFAEGALRRGAPLLAGFDAGASTRGRREARLSAVARAREGDAKPLAALHAAGRAPTLPAALRMIDARRRSDAFGPFEGVIAETGDAALGALGSRYGADFVWSASQLETYAACPFKFFARHVLSAEPATDTALDVNYRRRGSLVHDAFARLFGDPGDDATAIADRLRAALADVSDGRQLPGYEAALAAIEARQAAAWADRFGEQQAAYEARWLGMEAPLAPRYFEAKFGPARRAEGVDDVSTDEPLRLALPPTPTLGDGAVALVSGVVDRIDVGRVGDQTVFGVIDYKTAKQVRASAEELRAGRQLQLVIYALAAEQLFFGAEGATPVAAGYWGVQDKGFTEAKGLSPATIAEGRVERATSWVEAVDAAVARVAQIIAGVRGGDFRMNNPDKNCGQRCDFRHVCRIGQARAVGKAPVSTGGAS